MCTRHQTASTHADMNTVLQAKRTEADDNFVPHESAAAMEEAVKVWTEFKDSGLYEGIPPHSAARLLHPLFNACDKHEKYWATVSGRNQGMGRKNEGDA